MDRNLGRISKIAGSKRLRKARRGRVRCCCLRSGIRRIGPIKTSEECRRDTVQNRNPCDKEGVRKEEETMARGKPSPRPSPAGQARENRPPLLGNQGGNCHREHKARGGDRGAPKRFSQEETESGELCAKGGVFGDSTARKAREALMDVKLNGIQRDKTKFEEFRGGAQTRICAANRFGQPSPQPSPARRERENRPPLLRNRCGTKEIWPVINIIPDPEPLGASFCLGFGFAFSASSMTFCSSSRGISE